jgi:hypothetical protein
VLLNKYKALHALVKEFCFSSNVNFVILGSKLYACLKAPDFNLNHLINFKRDDVILPAIKQLKDKSHNEQLIPLLLSRGLADNISAEICKKIDTSLISDKNLQRIYSLFYLNPLNFIKFEIYKNGFNLDEHIVIDLIRSLASIYNEDLFEKIIEILSTFQFNQNCYDQMISSLGTNEQLSHSNALSNSILNSNFLFKNWILKQLKCDNISLPLFVKFCWFINNEDDLNLVEKGIICLKNAPIYDIIEKWSKIKKFEKLTRRIYHLIIDKKDDKKIKFYETLLDNCENEEERRMLERVYEL